MADTRPEPRSTAMVRAAVGLVLLLVGAGALGGLFYIGDSRSPGAEHALISLGLAGSVLASAIAQSLMVVGLWLLWRAFRRRAG